MSLPLEDASRAVPFHPPALGYPAALSPLLTGHCFRFVVEGRPVQAVLRAAGADEATDPASAWVTVGLGVRRGILVLPDWLVRAVLHAVEPAPLRPIEDATAILLLELALAAPLGVLEMHLDHPVQLLSLVGRPPVSEQPPLRVGCTGSFDGDPFTAELLLPRESLAPFLRAAHRLQPAARPDPALILAVRVGIASIDMSTLRSLRVGDAIVLRKPPGDRVVVVCGEAMAVQARWSDDRVTLDGPLQAATTLALENWIMTNLPAPGEADANAIAPEDALLDDLQVTLVFELGRKAATLRDVRALGVGHVIGLDPLARQQVSVLAGGRRIAEGELVQVGATMAVRLTRIAIA